MKQVQLALARNGHETRFSTNSKLNVMVVIDTPPSNTIHIHSIDVDSDIELHQCISQVCSSIDRCTWNL